MLVVGYIFYSKFADMLVTSVKLFRLFGQELDNFINPKLLRHSAVSLCVIMAQ